MPAPLIIVAGGAAAGTAALGIGGGVAFYKAGDGVEKNIIAISVIAAATFIAIKFIEKKSG